MKIKFKKSLKITIICAILLFIYAFIEPYWIRVKYYEINNNDIPAFFKGVKIVFVADIHHSKVLSLERIRGLVKEINSLKPDVVLLGGDYVSLSSEYIAPCFNELKELKATIGKYGVLGNHDHWEGANLTRMCMKNAGIQELDNKSEWINLKGEKIKIGGVGDMWEDSQILDNTISDVTEDDFVILLSHNPDFVEEIKNKKVDLVLSGHTHGGQVTLFSLWAPFVPSKYGQKYTSGLIKTEYTNVIVTKGIGYVGNYPVRFFSRPEIDLIELK